jgi:hypothetical protein
MARGERKYAVKSATSDLTVGYVSAATRREALIMFAALLGQLPRWQGTRLALERDNYYAVSAAR